MSRLVIADAADATQIRLDTTDPARIAAALGERGVRFERWRAAEALADDASQEAVLAAYARDVARVCAEGGYTNTDVVRLRPAPDDPAWPAKAAAARAKFLSEHTHSEDEVRFFVEGAGAFYLHLVGRQQSSHSNSAVLSAGGIVDPPRNGAAIPSSSRLARGGDPPRTSEANFVDDPLRGEVCVVVCGRGDWLSVPRGTRHWFDMGTQPGFCAIRFFQNADGWVAAFTGDDIATRMPVFDALAHAAALDGEPAAGRARPAGPA